MSERVSALQIREFDENDSISELTALVRQAYASLAEMGFRYLATWQDDEITQHRISQGECFIALDGEKIAGTITVANPDSTGGADWYDREDVASFQQFGVLPDYQGKGIGRQLLALAESRAREMGASELACDTAEGATHLISTYERHGYRIVGNAQWNATNYRSVILSKTL